MKLREKATIENMACQTRPAQQDSKRAHTVRWAVRGLNAEGQVRNIAHAGEKCIESIQPRLACTTGPNRRDQDGAARDQEDDGALVKLYICCDNNLPGE